MRYANRIGGRARNGLFVAIVGGGLLTSMPATAGGVILYEVGTADVGLASAGYGARAQDASTVLTNPAGMTRLPGSQATFGAQLLYGDYDFSVGSGTSAALTGGDGGNPIGWFPGGSAFFSHRVSPELSVGFGLAGNFGLALEYDDDWVGRYYVQEAALMGVSLLPSIAYRVNDQLSVGASINAMYGKMEEKVAINNPLRPEDGRLKVDDGDWGWGINLGLLYEVDPGTRFGLVYNSQVVLNFKSDAKFSNLEPFLQGLLGARGLLDAKIDLGMRVPQGLMGSVYHQLDDRWALLGSVGWQDWSKFGKVDIGISDTNNPANLTADLDFKDTWHAALGAQYRVSDPWRLHFGVAYDSEFQRGDVSPALPTNSAWRFGLGAQNEVSKTLSWSVSGEYAYGGTLDVDEPSQAPVALGGRGDLKGKFDRAGVFFLAATLNWKF
ncbi:MAG: OmpP1/FadL family transporter [Gammaproteobacteria bacterium]|jgi:long-chain fatty acid transport protein|nr:OmpP1/FadL family transporter [Gammaproteobacteria bacterium]